MGIPQLVWSFGLYYSVIHFSFADFRALAIWSKVNWWVIRIKKFWRDFTIYFTQFRSTTNPISSIHAGKMHESLVSEPF